MYHCIPVLDSGETWGGGHTWVENCDMQNIIPVASDQAMVASSTVLCSAHALPLPTDAPRSYWRNLSFTLFTTSFIRFKAWADVCVFSRDPRMFPGPYGSDIVRFKSLTTMVECSQVQSYLQKPIHNHNHHNHHIKTSKHQTQKGSAPRQPTTTTS